MGQDYTRDTNPGCWASLGWLILVIVGLNVGAILLGLWFL